eukprot:12406830-Karenia_brevis.AAC.1
MSTLMHGLRVLEPQHDSTRSRSRPIAQCLPPDLPLQFFCSTSATNVHRLRGASHQPLDPEELQ